MTDTAVHRPIPYRVEDEQVADDEPALFDRIAEAMRDTGRRSREPSPCSARLSHGLTLAALGGRLEVAAGLPRELAQGLFAVPANHEVVARLSHLPAETLGGSQVSSPRGLSFKVFGACGARITGHDAPTQDFLLETSPVFNARNPHSFLAAFSAVEAAAVLPQPVKSAISTGARAAGEALSAIGLPSANLDVLGHPVRHPLVEAYYSQMPMRWGDHVAKLAAFPESGEALALDGGTPVDVAEAVAARIAARPFAFTIAAQLRTDADTMPIEDARVPWSEDASPYRPVARLVFDAQPARDSHRIAAIESLSFAPGHSLEAHRPLGAIARARLHVYRILADERRRAGGQSVIEPQSAAVLRDQRPE